MEDLNIFQNFTYKVVSTTESAFFKLGVKVAQNPVRTIIICWILVILSTLGFIRFRQEKNPLNLWVPPHTSFLQDSKWLMSTVERGARIQTAIITGDNVLQPKVLREIFLLHEQVKKSVSKNNVTWDEVCFKIPKMDKQLLRYFTLRDPKSNKLMSIEEMDPSVNLNPALYCSFVEVMSEECFEKNVLELWDYKKDVIFALNQSDILYKINNYDRSFNMMGNIKNYEDLLGGVMKNENNEIIGAESIRTVWWLNINFATVDMDKAGNIAGTADWASEEALDWELKFSEIMEDFTKKSIFNVYWTSARSFGDISAATLFQDMDMLVFGVMIMFIYVLLVISKFNCLEARVVLGGLGLLTIGMSFIVGCGLCSLFGVYYGPVHTSLPFLLMGLGVDDMFVILSCWNELEEETKHLTLPERIGLMLKHAGVSITVTSFTDVVAFIIGSSTILPCLESFCIYAGVCVMMIYIFSITFFVACLTLDQRRIQSNRNGILICMEQEKNYVPNKCSQVNITNKIFEFVYSKIIFTWPGKITVVAITIACLGFSIESTLKLEKHFDPDWFIPEHTHLAKFIKTKKDFYPNLGWDAGLYMGRLNYTHEMMNIKNIVNELENMTDITNNVVSWVDPFRDFVLRNFKHDIFKSPLSEDRFNILLSKFLYSPLYAKFQANFQFNQSLECGIPAPEIKMSYIGFNFERFSHPNEYLPAMRRVRNLPGKANFTTGDKFSTVWSKIFSTWVTDEVIDIEVIRNLELALLCVMACTVLLIADIYICFWIFICVLITMVNVCGFMQRWGLTIDLVSCIGLELAIGLCVDYATHIGHTFLTIQSGTRRERALKTVSSIGSAVLYGGLSTLIGVFMLSQSEAYTFRAFFKIFLLVIIFGLFHGIVLLPVLLTWFGPRPYRKHNVLQPRELEELEDIK